MHHTSSRSGLYAEGYKYYGEPSWHGLAVQNDSTALRWWGSPAVANNVIRGPKIFCIASSYRANILLGPRDSFWGRPGRALEGRHYHSTLSLTGIDCHSLGIYTLICLSLL